MIYLFIYFLINVSGTPTGERCTSTLGRRQRLQTGLAVSTSAAGRRRWRHESLVDETPEPRLYQVNDCARDIEYNMNQMRGK